MPEIGIVLRRSRAKLCAQIDVETPQSCASTKSHASGKSKNPYFRILRKGSDVFLDADFN